MRSKFLPVAIACALLASIEGKKVKSFAVTTPTRLTAVALKDSPTMQEAGLKDFSVTIWQGLYAPKGTPAAVLKKLNDALKVSVKDPEFIRKQEGGGATVIMDARNDPAGHKAFIVSELAKWAPAVQRALPLHNTAAHLPAPPDPAKGRTLVLGAGKAGGAMAQAVEALWPADAPLSGLVVTRYGHTPPRPAGLPERIDVVEAAHPVPDASGLQAAERILELTKGLTADDLVLCLISGGGSALLTLPAEGISLQDKQDINRQLLASGANIAEMNCVRKHLS
eukprot:gene6698-6549_t